MARLDGSGSTFDAGPSVGTDVAPSTPAASLALAAFRSSWAKRLGVLSRLSPKGHPQEVIEVVVDLRTEDIHNSQIDVGGGSQVAVT